MNRLISIATLLFASVNATAQHCGAELLHWGFETDRAIYDAVWVCTGDTLKQEYSETHGMLTQIDGYWITCQEITENAWQWYMHYKVDTSMMPVTGITPDEAEQFCHILKLSDSYVWQIPTLQQWLFAFKGGLESEGYRYSGSNRSNLVGWTRENSGGKLHAGAQLIPNELRIYDMTGNVAEMVRDGNNIIYVGGSFLDNATVNPEASPTPPPEARGLRIVMPEAIWFDIYGKRILNH